MKPLNAVIAERSHYSRRKATVLIKQGRVDVNGIAAVVGEKINADDTIEIDGEVIKAQPLRYFKFNKPIGYECSKAPQGKHPSMYKLLPTELQHLNYVGRLDVDSRGLVLLTNDGQWLQTLTHPKYEIKRVYEVCLHRALSTQVQEKIIDGIKLKDGISSMGLKGSGRNWKVELSQGRNRQIRRTFAALGYEVLDLMRIQHGSYLLDELEEGSWQEIRI